ncbi:Hint domain-containing protein [Rhodosalinus sp.]|uniref:Hint domain-containing protein n=1 Tax=Rhodosalinus sp. TaxID=2047741 RepID=UPI00397D03D0
MPIALPLPSASGERASLPPVHAILAGEAGPVSLQALGTGDALSTAAGSPETVIWLGRRRITAARLAAAPRLSPVWIRRGALGDNIPARDLLLSPEQRVRFSDPRAGTWFGTAEIAVAALQLTFIPGVEQIAPRDVLYVHPILSAAGAIRVNGAWIEAAHPGTPEMDDPASPMRQELLRLFPELVTLRGRLTAAATARPAATAANAG